MISREEVKRMANLASKYIYYEVVDRDSGLQEEIVPKRVELSILARIMY